MRKIIIFLFVMAIMTGCTQPQKETKTETNTDLINQELEVEKNTDLINQEDETETNIDLNIQVVETVIEADWLIEKLTKNFKEHNFTLQEIYSQEIGYPETKVLGFNDSGVNVVIFENNHEVFGNDQEFAEAISRYITDEYYGEIMLEEKQVNPDVLLQYTKAEVMANHGAMKKEYFYTFPDNTIVKIKVTFPGKEEIDGNPDMEIISNKVNEIEEIILSDF